MEALNIPEEDFTSIFIRYGLYVGALFQIVCLGAVIFLPSNPNPSSSGSIWSFLKVRNQQIELRDFFLYLIDFSFVIVVVVGRQWRLQFRSFISAGHTETTALPWQKAGQEEETLMSIAQIFEVWFLFFLFQIIIISIDCSIDRSIDCSI